MYLLRPVGVVIEAGGAAAATGTAPVLEWMSLTQPKTGCRLPTKIRSFGLMTCPWPAWLAWEVAMSGRRSLQSDVQIQRGRPG